ncbi:MAG: NAD(P)/FAD-dependent oxidoreductase [Chromatiales bacterium]
MNAVARQVDVLIVGGGPGGSSVAWGLRGAGLSVAVLDKASFPRTKVCAGWITPAVVQALQLDLADYARTRIIQPIHGFRVGLIGGNTLDLDYPGDPVSYGIRRCEFDHYLLTRSEAKLWEGEAFRDMRREEDGWLVNGNTHARLVVGAGGHFCPVARALGARLGQSEQVVAAQEVEFELNAAQQARCRVRHDVPELYFCPDLRGYGWIFRKGDWLNVGLGREDNHRLGDHVRDFLAWLKTAGRVPPDMPDRFQGHAYLLYHHAVRPETADGVLLVGDATGLAYPQSGEGIRPAIESGLLAAAVIRETNGDYRESPLAAYGEHLAIRFGRRHAASTSPMRVPHALKTRIGRALLGTRWFNRHFVIDRWFLHRHQPAFLGASAG